MALAFAYLGGVQSVDYDNTTIIKVEVSRAVAADCKTLKNRRKCKFNAKNLQFDSSNAIELTVSTGGRKITCDKVLGTGKKRWYGTCDGDANDANFITRVDTSGKESVFGSIHVGGDICKISPNIHGEDEIQCSPQSDYKSEYDPVSIPLNRQTEQLSDTRFGFASAYIANESQPSLRGYNRLHGDGRELFDNSGGNIDTMVLWTKAAECVNAGLIATCSVNATTENKMRGLVDLAITETNTAYELSGIFSMLRLVHAYRDSDYVESGNVVTDLNRLASRDDVRSKRSLYGADIVHMIASKYRYSLLVFTHKKHCKLTTCITTTISNIHRQP
jgi:hypothetical protein